MAGKFLTVGFLVAAGQEVGGGHLMRCLSIARALQGLGARVCFFCGPLPEPLAARCKALGIPVKTLSEVDVETADRSIDCTGISILVVDGYQFDEPWRLGLRRSHRKLVVMDDLNVPPVHTADAIINALPEAERLGYGDSAPQAKQWLGPEYAPLAPNFGQPVTLEPAMRNGLLVTFGASDPMGYSLPLLRALLATVPDRPPSPVRIVTGPAMASDQVQRIHALAASHGAFEHHHDCQDMRSLMARSGLAVSAAGGTIYELAACGVPTLAVAVSPNQQRLAASLERQVTWCKVLALGPDQAERLAQAAWRLWSDVSWRQTAMGEARCWLDGQGSRRLAEHIIMLAREGDSR